MIQETYQAEQITFFQFPYSEIIFKSYSFANLQNTNYSAVCPYPLSSVKIIVAIFVPFPYFLLLHNNLRFW